MDQGNQPINPPPSDPLGVLREYLQERQLTPYISRSKNPNMLWDCRLTCGPYLVHGTSFDREEALVRAAKAMLEIFDEIRNFPRVDVGLNENTAERLNREYIQKTLVRIEERVLKFRHWWNSACVILLREELAHLLRTQGIELIERVYPKQTETLVVWEITSNPRILTGVTGQNPERIRFHLLLDSINNLKIRLNVVQ